MDIPVLRASLSRISRRLRHEARNSPSTWSKMLVLSAIDRLGETASPAVIAYEEKMRSSNLAALLRSLEGENLVHRARDEVDKRKVRVYLTESGTKLLAENRFRRDTWLLAACSAGLTECEQQQLAEAIPLLKKLADYDSEL